MVPGMHFLRQMLIERKRPRNYEKNGLVKLKHPEPGPTSHLKPAPSLV
jgi:hypothetical protein